MEYGVSYGSYIVPQTDFTLLFGIVLPPPDYANPMPRPTLTIRQVNCESYNSRLNVPHYLPGNYHVLLDARCITISWRFNGNYTTIYIMSRILYVLQYTQPPHHTGPTNNKRFKVNTYLKKKIIVQIGDFHGFSIRQTLF